ncbi:MAG: rRNA adenine N-6-methyltransferase family protein, partial [Candidatus Nitrosotenuis sp.]
MKSKQKKLGQNFLKNKRFLKLISQVLEIKNDDIVVEIGGGHGELSGYLLKAK